MSGTHAVLSPSSAVRWMTCPGSVVLSANIPSATSAAAARGTVGHTLVERALAGINEPRESLGINVDMDGVNVLIDEDLIAQVEQCIAEGRAALEGSDAHWLEVAVPIGHLTGEEGATGTADLLIAKGRRLEVHDWKFGYNEVDAENNPQMMMYALGALELLAPVSDFDEALLVIHQPGHGGPKEWLVGVGDLHAFAVEVQTAGASVRTAQWAKDRTDFHLYLNPSNDACRFCPARATCPALRAEVEKAVVTELTSVSDDGLGEAMSKVERVEAWCKEVRAETERRLLAGAPVPGWKLVQGRRGARKWVDEEAALRVLDVILGDDAYEKSVISPSTAEKVLKKKDPTAWEVLANHVTQSEGKPSVAPASDKREAINPADASADFAVIN